MTADADFKVGDWVIRKAGSMDRPAEVRAVFLNKRGKLMLALEYEGDVFRVVRIQQVRKWSIDNVLR